MLLAYAARALPLTGIIFEDVCMHVYPDGMVQFKAEELLKNPLNPLVETLHTAVAHNLKSVRPG